MSATLPPTNSGSTVNKPLWAAVGVLGVAVLAMGATLIHIQTRPVEPTLAVLSTAAPITTKAVGPTEPTSEPALLQDEVKPSVQKKPAVPANRSSNTTKSAATKATKPAETNASVYSSAVPVTKPICAKCGTVESITPIQRDGTAGGVGAVTGGVLGAVVGNQVGDGNGKTLATILGAVGGGFAGNAVEKKMKKETVYLVRVQMEDGSTRTVEQSTPASVGAKVIVEGRTLQSANR